ncbi:MAG: exo-alpha-sialidase [Bacteroidota bacterium]
MKTASSKILLLFLTILTMACSPQQESAATEEFMQMEIFPPQQEHAHGATIVELQNGDMLAAWFQGHGERWADDVRIMGARLLKGESQWSAPFVMADVPDFPDINPVLFIDPQETLWLVWYTVIANQWSTSLPKYRTSTNYMQKSGPPVWEWQDVIHFKPGDKTERGIQPGDSFVESVRKQTSLLRERLEASGATKEQLEEYNLFAAEQLDGARGDNMIRSGGVLQEDGSRKSAQLGYPYFRRMGWQTKNKAVFVGDRIIIPFYSDGLEMSIMAITDDYGTTWKFSTPLVGIANIQPSMAFREDGTIVAYMRDNGPPPNRHPVSESKDNGITWSPVTDSELLNPGSGSDIVTLSNGYWILAYNDLEDGRHSLAVSLSEDGGKSWSYTRHIEQDLGEEKEQRTKFAYPSIIEGHDGMIHLVYSLHKHHKIPDPETIKYARFTRDWIKACDKSIATQE